MRTEGKGSGLGKGSMVTPQLCSPDARREGAAPIIRKCCLMDSWWPGEGKAVEANSVLSVFAFLKLDMLYCTKLRVIY